MPDEDEPERKHYTLKPKSFERVNRPSHEEPQGIVDVHAMLQQNLAADVNANRGLVRAENKAPAAPAALRPDPVPPVLPVARVGSRRKKDFLTTLVCAAAVLAVPAFLLRDSELALIGLGSAFALFTVVTAWIFWGIMDRY